MGTAPQPQKSGQNETLVDEKVTPVNAETADPAPAIAIGAVRVEELRGPLDWSHRHQSYLQKRGANNAFWTNQAVRHGSALEATASTDWVRSASLRRLKQLIKPTDETLEVGCGNASSLLGPLSHSCRAYGADLTLEMLVAAKEEHTAIKGLVRSDACRLPFPDGKFGVVYTSRCLINVLDSAMQSLAIREVFRVAKPGGSVILIENFEEPVAAANRAIRDWSAGTPIRDEHNLLLNLERTMDLGRELGWIPVRVFNNTLASFITHTAIRKIGQRRGAGMIDRALFPLYEILTRMEDRFGARLPRFGKDTMVVFKRPAI
jgi:SAM-dependent methyltransferase